jgi:hypothetical protein
MPPDQLKPNKQESRLVISHAAAKGEIGSIALAATRAFRTLAADVARTGFPVLFYVVTIEAVAEKSADPGPETGKAGYRRDGSATKVEV